MNLVLRPEAAQELLDAQAWYEAQVPGLGFEFARIADAAIAAVLRNPLGANASRVNSGAYCSVAFPACLSLR